MAKVEANAVHVKVMPDEALDSKRMLLEIQLNLLGAIRKIISYKELREEEFQAKKEARMKIQEVGRLVKDTLSILPLLEQAEESKGVKGYNISFEEAKKQVARKDETEKTKAKKDKKTKLDEELELIKQKLESLQ